MDYHKLKQEIQGSPQKYGGKSHKEVETLLNTKNIVAYEPIPMSDVLLWTVRVTAFRKLESVNQISPLYDAAKAFLLMLQSRSEFNVGKPEVQDLLTQFVTGGIITAAQRQDLLNMGLRQISRADQLGLGYCSAGDIAEALIR